MINLIPTEEKKTLKRYFYLRVLTVFFGMLSCAIFIAAILMLPAFVISLEKKNSIEHRLELQRSEAPPEIDQQAQIAVKELNGKLNVIEKAMREKYVFSEKIVNEIITRKTDGIKITEILYENDKEKGRTVSVSGMAKSREQLLAFRMALENSPIFKNVDLPISNFVKGNNIQFDLTLIAS